MGNLKITFLYSLLVSIDEKMISIHGRHTCKIMIMSHPSKSFWQIPLKPCSKVQFNAIKTPASHDHCPLAMNLNFCNRTSFPPATMPPHWPKCYKIILYPPMVSYVLFQTWWVWASRFGALSSCGIWQESWQHQPTHTTVNHIFGDWPTSSLK